MATENMNTPEYPEVTKGSKMAREMREECNNLTDEQREELLKETLAVASGGHSHLTVKELVALDEEIHKALSAPKQH